MMRGVLYLVLIVLVLAVVGWITFNHDPSRPGINLETQKVKDDTRKAMETGSDLLKKAERSIHSSDGGTPDSAGRQELAQPSAGDK
jgi:hypothetical protein